MSLIITYSLVLGSFLTSLSFLVASASSDIENEAVDRYIDISTQLVIVNTKIKVRNNNNDPADNYVFSVDPEWTEDLSYISALDDKNKNPLTVLNAPEIYYPGRNVSQYKIMFSQPLFQGDSMNLVVLLVVTNYLKSYPSHVNQHEKHMVLFPFNVYYYSIYFSKAQTTSLYMGTTKVAHIDGAKYTLANDSKYGLQYGPFHDVEPFEVSQSVFHFENNSPFLVVEKVKRFIKLSHWGFISVWNEIELRHSGPKLKGPFKRSIDKNTETKDTSIKRFDSTLPSSAFDIYLKDGIGLIWSFDVDYDGSHGVVVSVEPRFILYGGWKIDYEIGYTLPFSDFLKSHFNDEYTVGLPLIDSIFENMVVKEAEINIILPEGAIFDTVDSQFGIGNVTNTKYCYYFDTTCREMITFRKYNVIEKHISNVYVAYTFSRINLLVMPFKVALYLYLMFTLLKISSVMFSSTESIEAARHVKRNVLPVTSNTIIKEYNKQKSTTKNKRQSKHKQF